MNSSNLEVGNVVKFIDNTRTDSRGFFRIKSIRGRFANLTGVFGRHIYHKSVPLTDLRECEGEWYAAWRKTESYQCM